MKDYFQQADSPYFSTKATNEFIHSWQHKRTLILRHFTDKLWWATQLLDGLRFVTFVNETCETFSWVDVSLFFLELWAIKKIVKSPELDTFFLCLKNLWLPQKTWKTKSRLETLVSKGEILRWCASVFVDFFRWGRGWHFGFVAIARGPSGRLSTGQDRRGGEFWWAGLWMKWCIGWIGSSKSSLVSAMCPWLRKWMNDLTVAVRPCCRIEKDSEVSKKNSRDVKTGNQSKLQEKLQKKLFRSATGYASRPEVRLHVCWGAVDCTR